MNFLDYIRNVCMLFCIMCICVTNAQIAVTNNPPFDTEENIVVNVLLGNGIDASNFSSVVSIYPPETGSIIRNF